MNYLNIRQVPIVYFHIGNQPYLYRSIQHNKQFGSVVLIGDESNRNADCIHVKYNQLETPELIEFTSNFVNYSTNSKIAELLCFVRMFYLRRWMELNSIREVVHVDSDCLLFRPLSEMFPDKKLAYIYRSGSDRMAASIHISFLTYEFLLAFEQLCRDIYVTKTKFHLIEEKIKYHQENGIPGGICDMTLYYLLTKELDVRPLMDIQPDGSTFDDNINDTNGFAGPNTFVHENNIKVLRQNGIVVEAKCVDGSYIRMNNIHYQGRAKKYIV